MGDTYPSALGKVVVRRSTGGASIEDRIAVFREIGCRHILDRRLSSLIICVCHGW